jgi:microcystin-dependent protein
MADVASTLAAWSPVSNNNAPSGTTTIGTGFDDNLRELAGVVVRGLSHKGADIASSTTTDLGAVEGKFHDITGTTSISSFGTVRAGIEKWVKFEGSLTLVYNATSLITLTGANRRVKSGDVGCYISEGSGNWRELVFTEANVQVPSGMLFDFAGTTAPTGYLACDGSAVSRTTYAALFAAISTTWGVGDGSTTFTLPDFRRRVAVGSGGSGTATLGASVGNTGGAESVTLTGAESGTSAHTHTITDSAGAHTHTVSVSDNTGGGIDSVNATTGWETNGTNSQASVSMASGGAHNHTINNSSAASAASAHNNLQPSAVVLKIIKT